MAGSKQMKFGIVVEYVFTAMAFQKREYINHLDCL